MIRSLSPEERKRRSEEICHHEGVPVNSWLPVIEDEYDSKIRTVDDVAGRAMCLCLVAMKASGMENAQVSEIVRDFDLENKFSSNETSFLALDTVSERDRANLSWRFEAFWVLLWALEYIDDLGRPDQVCDVKRAVKFMYESKSPTVFIERAGMRKTQEILDQVDLIYRYSWACVDARLHGRPAPAGLHPGVVYERHYAFNWLVNYQEQNWDDVSTDT